MIEIGDLMKTRKYINLTWLFHNTALPLYREIKKKKRDKNSSYKQFFIKNWKKNLILDIHMCQNVKALGWTVRLRLRRHINIQTYCGIYVLPNQIFAVYEK